MTTGMSAPPIGMISMKPMMQGEQVIAQKIQGALG